MRDTIRYTAILTAFADALVAFRYGLTWGGVFAALICAFLVLIAVFDYQYRRILNILIFPGIGVAILVHALLFKTSLWGIFVGGITGILLFGLAKWASPGDLGGGDIKLAGLIGVLFGFPNALWALTIGVLAGGVVVIYLQLIRKVDAGTRIPYAPCLCFGAITFLLSGPSSFLPP